MVQDMTTKLEQRLTELRATLARETANAQRDLAETRALLDGANTAGRTEIVAYVTERIHQLETSEQEQQTLLTQQIATTEAILTELQRRQTARH
jgi:hypothetical protein